MKPTDLRIGNIIKWKYGEDNYNAITGVDEEMIGIDTITPFGVEPKDIEPIQITEEWLVRFGFEKEHGYFIKSKMKFDINTIGKVRFHWSQKVTYIDYVHQLQNLYFALIGEELILKQ